MATYFVCVDACVLIDLFVEIIGNNGATPKWWEELKALIDGKEAKLLVPEVTLMEFRKWVRRKLQTVPKTAFKIQPPSGHEGFDGVISEQLSTELKGPNDEWLKQKAKDWQTDSDKVLNLLKDGEQIAFTLEIQHKTKCRIIEGLFYKRPGKAGDDELKRDQDCFIIDSLVDYFETHDEGKLDDKIVLFGTKDGGFGPFKDEPEMIGQTGMIDTLFQDGLPPTKLFTNLEDVVKFIKTQGTINLLVEPPAKKEPEEIESTDEEVSARVPAETIIAVPSSGGRVIEVVVRDQMTANDSVNVTTTPVPVWAQPGIEAIQRELNNRDFIRQLDEQRRRRNAENNMPPPSFFAPAPDTKTARIKWDEQGPLAGQQLRRWTDRDGVAWRVGLSAHVSIDEPSPQVTITLDRSQAANAIGDVSEECDHFLRTLRFSYQRVVPQRRLGGVSIGPYLEEVLDPEPPYAEPPQQEVPHQEVPLEDVPVDDVPPPDNVPHDEVPPDEVPLDEPPPPDDTAAS